MTEEAQEQIRQLERRVLVLAPNLRDAWHSHGILAGAGMAAMVCRDLAGICRELERGAGALLLTEEAMAAEGFNRLVDWLRAQPPWSDLPVLMLVSGALDSPSAARAIEKLTNVLLLQRPVHVAALIGTARSALAARARQFQMRDYLEERRQAEAAMRESQERFAAFMDHLPGAAWMKDLRGRYVYVNPEAERVFSKSFSEIQGRTDREIFPPEIARHFRENDSRALAEGSVETTEVLRQADGAEHYAIVSKFAVPGSNGGAAFVGGVAFDVTERLRAEEELRKREAELRLIMNATPALLSHIDADYRYLRVNQSYEHWFGRPAQEVEGRHVREVLGEEAWGAVRPYMRRALGGEVVTYEQELPFQDGPRWIHATYTPERDAWGRVRGFVVHVMDISERKRAEQALRESEEKFRIVAENAQAVFGIVQGRQMVYANPYVPKLTGYSIDELLTMDISLLVHPDSRGMVVDYARRRQLGEPVPTNYEFAMITKSGQKRWLDLSVGRIEYNGKPAIVGTAYDVTARKEAEEALAESERRLAGIIDSAMDAIVIIDEQQRIILFNPAAEQMFRCRAEQAIGSSIDRFIPERFREVHREHIREFARTGNTARAMGHLRPLAALRADGEEFPIEASVSQVKLGGPGEGQKLLSVILRDITERQRAEQALRESEAQVHLQAAALEAAASAVALSKTDAHGTIVWVNKAFTELTGYSAEEAIGQSHRILRSGQQDEAFYRQLWETINRGQVWHGELVNRRKDGMLYHEEMSITPVRDGEGRISHYVAIKQDITARKRATDELAAARRAAEEASRAKDHFLAVLSHELRTPLTPVLATAELLATDARLTHELRQDLDMIRRNVALEARLIDDLLDLTRVARGKIELAKRLVPLCEIILQAVEVCRADIESRQLHFSVDLGETAPYFIEADPARLQQVFWNLLKNAIKFTPPGGQVGIRVRRPELKVLSPESRLTPHSEVGAQDSALRTQDWIVAEVSDSGMGIEPEAMGRIFNAFEQAERTIARQFGGLGLGLAISKAMVEMHGGGIEAHSEGKGRGATFRVKLPLHSSPESKVLSPEPNAYSALRTQHSGLSRPLRVLLVEDHGDTARVMTKLLTRRGYQVRISGDVGTALDLASRESFDLLVSDLGLPDRSGVELIRELRLRDQMLPAIALSGYGQEEDVNRSREAGFAAHLIKPVDFEQFYRTIDRVVSLATR